MHSYPPDTGTQPMPVVSPPPRLNPQHGPSPKKRVALMLAAILLACVLVIAAGAAWNAQHTPSSSTGTVTVTPDTTTVVNGALTATAIANFNATITSANQNVTDVPYTPTVYPSPTPHSDIGSSQTSGPWSITVNSVSPTRGGEFDTPHAGNHFILINFTAHNTDLSPHDMSPVWFTLRDEQGNTYDLAYISVPHDPRGTVVPGQQLRGDLSYELPVSLHAITLQFDPPEDTDNSQIVQWNLTV